MAGKTLFEGGAASVLWTDRRQFYINSGMFAELWPAVTPFLSNLMASTRKLSGLADPIFKMFEHENPWIAQEFSVNGAVATQPTGDTESSAIAIDGITGLRSTVDESFIGLQCEVWNSTRTTLRGQFVVTSISGTSLLVKTLGITGDISDNDICVVIGNAQGDGADAPEAWSDELRVVWNSTQNFRTPVEVKGALLTASLRGANDELARLRVQKAQTHAIQMNRAFLRSKSILGTNLDASNPDTFTEASNITDAEGNMIRTTMGAVSAIKTYGDSSDDSDHQNIFDRSQGYLYNNFIDDSYKVMQYLPNSGVARAYCGPVAMSFWDKVTSDGKLSTGFPVQLSEMKRASLGYFFKYLETPFGVIELIPEPAFRDAGYQNHMFIPDERNLFYAEFEGSAYYTNIKTDNRPNLVKDEWSSDLGVGMTLLKAHKLFYLPATA